MSEAKTYSFHITGMHCPSCVLYLEETLSRAVGVRSIKADLDRRQVTVTGELGDDLNSIAKQLTEYVRERGYALSVEQGRSRVRWNEFAFAVPLAALIIVGFVALQKIGWVNLISSTRTTYATAFTVGLIASVSTCLAVVGGLVLSLSANYINAGKSWKPQTMFHIGRLIGFFVLGGGIGALGNALHLDATGNLILGIVVAVVMLLLGINLLDIFKITKRVNLTMPKFFGRHLFRSSSATNALAPLLVGIGTFFLPCGFTQSMQLYSLTTQSFLKGGLTMLFFALGTLPILALLSFGSINISRKSWSGIFFKTAGIVVIAFALFNFVNTLAAASIITPLFNL